MTAAQLTPEQMQAGMMRMQEQLHVQAKMVKDMQEAAGVAAAAAVPLPGGRGAARPPHLPTYDGSKGLDEWFLALRQQDRWYGYQDAPSRLRLATAYLAGPALAWYEFTYPAAAVPVDWATFEAALRARFQPITSAETARAKLITISQGSMSVQDYVSAFNTLLAALPAPHDEAMNLHLFLRGLKPHTREMLRAKGVADYKEAITMAVRVGNPMPVAASSSSSSAMDLSAIEDRSPTAPKDSVEAFASLLLAAIQSRMPVRNHGSGSGSGKAQSTSSGWGPNTVRGGPPSRVEGLTPRQAQAYYDADRCFHCGGIGHRRYDCPKKAAGEPQSGK